MTTTERAILGGGCFWCVEAVYDMLEGVHDVRPGYAGGHVANPTYREVCEKTTGHAEVVEVVFDPAVISYHDVLEVFFTAHDPTTVDRQGNDVGPQYRSVIYTTSPAQADAARTVIAEFDAGGAADDVLAGRGGAPGLFRAQSVPAVLRVRGVAEGAEGTGEVRGAPQSERALGRPHHHLVLPRIREHEPIVVTMHLHAGFQRARAYHGDIRLRRHQDLERIQPRVRAR